MDITPWPGGEREKSIPSCVGGELSELGPVLVGLSGGVVKLNERQRSKIAVLEVK